MITLEKNKRQAYTFAPRPYQRKAVDDVKRKLWGSDSFEQFSCLLKAATGAGKTKMAGMIIAESGIIERGGKVLFLCHKIEPIKQAISGFNNDFNIATGKYTPKTAHLFQVYAGTVQQFNEGKKLPDGVELIILDECHTVSYYKQVMGLLKHYLPPVWSLGSRVKVLGLTATPMRNNFRKEGFCWLFRSVVSTPPIEYFQQEGFLAHDRLFGWEGLLDYSQLKVNKSDDYTTKSLDTACNRDFFQLCINKYLETCPERRGIFFCSSVAKAKELAEMFTEQGVPAEAICGENSDANRKELLERFALGEIRIITNPFVFAEGMDTPYAECVGICRPVRSPAQLVQMAGRGTRLCAIRIPTKKDVFVLDFTGSFGEVGKRVGIDGFRLSVDFPLGLCPQPPREIRDAMDMSKECPDCGTVSFIFTKVCPQCGHIFSTGEEDEGVAEVPDFGEYIDPVIKGMVAKMREELKQAYFECKNPVAVMIRYKKGVLKGVYVRDEWLTGIVHKFASDAAVEEYSQYLQQTIPNLSEAVKKQWIKREFGRLPEALPWRNIFGVGNDCKLHDVGKAYLHLSNRFSHRKRLIKTLDEAMDQARLELRYKQQG